MKIEILSGVPLPEVSRKQIGPVRQAVRDAKVGDHFVIPGKSYCSAYQSVRNAAIVERKNVSIRKLKDGCGVWIVGLTD